VPEPPREEEAGSLSSPRTTKSQPSRTGKKVVTVAGPGGKAAEEMEQLWDWVKGQLRLPPLQKAA